MKSNHLINESSPYLQQHAHNPVDWFPWGPEALNRAIDEDKPIILSIGYSTCHWCHVMERESFEDDSIADLMNSNYICIKVDREERPDVDQIYMDALNVMGVQGGWPLNVFLMPDTKPFYGGTYFPPSGWTQLLENINEAFQRNRSELLSSAEKFTEALEVDSIMKYSAGDSAGFNVDVLDHMLKVLSKSFDKVNGGTVGAPKFPMPAIWNYLNLHVDYTGDKQGLSQLLLTLRQMAFGGIYDHVGGGFARYSTDDQWFAPHFEKMLYDNGQLLSLYSRSSKYDTTGLYKQVVFETVAWLEREMTDDAGGFYAALDADSEGVEGKFYVWTDEELKEILGDSFDLASKYYNSNAKGNWEEGVNILHRSIPDAEFCTANDIDSAQLDGELIKIKSVLLDKRASRVRPGLDTKVLIAWNALTSKGLLDAYTVFNEKRFLEMAQRNMDFMLSEMIEDNTLYHVYGKKISGFLDDYALFIQALVALYQSNFEEKYLIKAKVLTDHVLSSFYDKGNYFFFYTSQEAEKLIANRKELFDNVIPSSNAIMAGNLFDLGILFDNAEYLDTAKLMVGKVSGLIKKEPRYMSKWAQVYHNMLKRPAEVVVVGADAQNIAREVKVSSNYSMLVSGTASSSDLPLVKGRTAVDGKTTIYVCKDNTCQLPVHTVKEAIEQIEKIQE